MSIAVENKGVQKPDVLSYRDALLPKKAPGFQAYSVWCVALFFVLFQFFIQLSSGEIVNGLMKSFSLTALGGGFLASAYYYIYVALQTPAGILMGQYGPRKLLSCGALVLMIGSFIFASAHYVAIAFLGRLLMGMGAAFAFVGTMHLTDMWFPRERFALMAGLIEMTGMAGTLIGVFWLANYVEVIGWRDCMYFIGGISGLLSVLLALVIRDMPANRRPLSAKKIKRRVLPGLRVLVRMKVAWANAIYSGMMFMLVTVFAALWGLPYIRLAQHMSLIEATFYCSLVYIAVGIFSPLLGHFDSKITHRRYLMCGLAVLGFIAMMLIILFPTMPKIELGICMFCLGIAASGYMLTFAVANQIAAMRIRSASIGFVNTWSVGTSPVLQPLIGLILYLLAKHDHPFQTNLYTVHEYQVSLLILPACLAIAAWLALFIPSRK
jgi:MFS family permease